MTKILAISNQKGGVGKTTTAVNLSTALGLKGKKVLLVDLDPQGNATSSSGLEKTKLKSTVYDLLINDADIKEVVKKGKYYDVVPANQHLAGAEIEMIQIKQREVLLKNQLKIIQQDYDYILLDCPPSLGLITLNGLTAATSVLIPMQCEYFALEGLTDLVNTIKKIKTNMNKEIQIEGLLRTIYDRRNTLSKEVSDQLSTYFPNKVYKTIVPRNVRVAEAPSHGLSAIQFDKHSKGSKAYLELADEIIKKEANNG
jgi:chromosome partitioning protein